ncbi:MAG: hypothetical protein R3C03_05700 [Pirellulaceae bacterium]
MVRKTGLMLIVAGVLCLNAGMSLAQDAWGHLAGKLVATGDVPEASAEAVDKDQATCMVDGNAPLDDNLVVGDDGGLRDVYVLLYLGRGDDAPAIHPSYEELAKEKVVLDNARCRFEPHAIVVRTGQPIELKNSDDVGHNCHIITLKNEENVNLPANDSVEVKLNNADKLPGNVVCDIHKWMDAVILVRDDPYAAISAADGTFRIENIPAGKWQFQLWHKKKGFLRGVKVGDQETGRRGEFEVEITDGKDLDLGSISIDVSDWK